MAGFVAAFFEFCQQFFLLGSEIGGSISALVDITDVEYNTDINSGNYPAVNDTIKWTGTKWKNIRQLMFTIMR